MVYGEVDGEYYGITKIMDICEKYDCKGTFFVSTFESKVLGEDGMREVCQEIYRRGHDVQLHTHPKWITKKGYMWDHTLKEQEELLNYGKNMILKWIGEYPIAHRAGSFGSDQNTLSALKSAGIPIDSSNVKSPYCKLDTTRFTGNTLQVSDEGIIELPVTIFTQFKLGHFRPVKPFDINANTLGELKFVISSAKANNLKIITLLMHSFSFLNRNKNRTEFTLNKGDMKKFEKLLELISKDDTLDVITLKEFYNTYTINPQLFEGKEYLPVSGYIRSIIRACRYIKRGRGNQLIVLFVLSIILLFFFSLYLFLF
jgi:peptidoglycan/xylan/chitin deacetylase (PgdA/CDA1 family)